MLLNLSHTDSEPLHQQIYRQIRGLILSGRLAPGETLASIRSLARSEKVSVITVGRAYEELDRAGLIHTRQGRPSIVADLSVEQRREIAHEELVEQIEPIIQQALRDGLPSDRLLITIKKILARHGAS